MAISAQSYYNRLIAGGSDPRTANKLTADYARSLFQRKSAGYMAALSKGSSSVYKGAAGTAGMVATPAIAASGAAASTLQGLASGSASQKMAAASPLGSVASASAGNIIPKSLISSSTSDLAMAAAKEAQTTAQKKVETEIKTQQSLAPIRQRRKQQAQQQAKSLRRTTGRQALLASPRGGAGFFGGYFK